MAGRRKVANLLALAVLSYLTQRPMHPYELSRTLQQNGDARSIKFNHGSLYMVVQQLAKAGFVAPQETVRDGARPERTVYALTNTGQQELHEWMRDLMAEPQHEYPQFVAALSLVATLAPGEVVELLGSRLRRLSEQLAEIRTETDAVLGQGVHPLFLVEEEYRIALLEAESSFCQQLLARISDPATGWGQAWVQARAEVSAGG
jgi:DNA-binding PadR family transcriptional regulator